MVLDVDLEEGVVVVVWRFSIHQSYVTHSNITVRFSIGVRFSIHIGILDIGVRHGVDIGVRFTHGREVFALVAGSHAASIVEVYRRPLPWSTVSYLDCGARTKVILCRHIR